MNRIAALFLAFVFCVGSAQASVVTSGGNVITGSSNVISPSSSIAQNYLYQDIVQWPTLQYYARLTDANGTSSPVDSGPNAYTGSSVSGSVTFGSTPIVGGSTNTSALFAGGYVDGGAALETALHDWEYTQAFHFEAVVVPNYTRTSTETGTIFAKGAYTTNAGTSVTLKYASTTKKNVLRVTIRGDSTHYMSCFAVNVDDFKNGQRYHIAVDYTGSAARSGITLWVNGIYQNCGTDGGQSTISTSIVNSNNPTIGANTGGTNPFHGYIQEVALWNVSNPAGTSANIAANSSNTVAQGNLAWYHSQLALGAAPAPSVNPSGVPNVVIEDDISGDVDGVGQLAMAIYMHKNNLINLLAWVVNSADPYAASVSRAILDYNSLTAIPVYAYLGTGTDQHTIFTQTTAGTFRSADATNQGVTVMAVGTGGTQYQVGDVVTVSGGTLAAGFSAATGTVTSVSGGAITGLRVSNSGSYSSLPSTPNTVSNPHGGTAATIDLTLAIKRGNYTDATSGVIDILNNNSNIYWINTGISGVTYSILTNAVVSNSATLFASKVRAYICECAYAPDWQHTQYTKAGSWNVAQNKTQWNYIWANWPSTVPFIVGGDEQTTPINAANGLIYAGPANVTSYATDPVQAAYKTAGTNGTTFASGYLRAAWAAPALMFAAYGINVTGGDAYSQYLYWGGTRGTGTIQLSTGYNYMTNSWGPFSYLRLRATPTAWNTWMATMLNSVSP